MSDSTTRATAAARSAEQRRDDMVNYGPCPLCGTARTLRLAELDGITTASLSCPAEFSHGADTAAAQ